MFNQTSIETYLCSCYSLLRGSRTEIKTVVHICATHMIKAFRDSMRDKILDKGLREIVLRSLAVLQNCTQLNESIFVWRVMCIAISNPYITEDVKNNLSSMQKLIKTASLDGIDDELLCDAMGNLSYIYCFAQK